MDNIMIPTIDWRTHNISSTETSTPATHELHPTGLEGFMTCPYKFYVQSHPELFPNVKFGTPIATREAFYTGDIVEQLMTAYQYGEKLGDEVLRNFGNSTEYPLYSQLKAHTDNWKNYIKDAPQNIKDRYPLFTQKRMTLRILMDADQNANSLSIPPYHEIYLTGTADWIYSDYTIADCKCYKQKWGKNEPDRRLQWRLYGRMWRQVSNLPQLKKKDNFDFTYYIFTKQVHPQLQVVNLNYKYEDSERLIYHLLSEYIKAYDNNERTPSKCLACKRCPLRDQCPLYGEDGMTSFNATPGIDNNSSSSEEGEWRF